MRRSIPFAGPFTTAEAYAAGLTSGVLRGPSVRRLFASVYVTAEVESSEQVLVAAALKVVPQAVVVGVTALHVHGIDIGPATPLYLVNTNPHPVRRPGLKVARVGALPPHRESVAVAEHAFTSAATQLNLLDLVTAGTGCCAATDAVCPPCGRTRQVSPVAGPSRRVVPPDLFAPGWTRREGPRCGSA